MSELLRKSLSKVSVFEALTYRDFLKRLYEDIHGGEPDYSYLDFASDLGFSHSNVIRLVVQGKRRLTKLTSERIITTLGFKNQERRYFKALVDHGNTRRIDLREKHFQKILQLKSTLLPSESDKRKLEYFSKWLHPVLFLMAKMPGFKPDPDWILKNIGFKISVREVNESLELLHRLGVLAVDLKTHELKLSSEDFVILPTDAAASDLAVVRYHQQVLTLAKEAVPQTHVEQNEFNSMTLTLSRDDVNKIKEKMRNFCLELLELENACQNGEDVVQVSLQMFSCLNSDRKPRNKP